MNARPVNAPGAVRVSAPGKLMISGEYVVLDGVEALVASVDRRLFATGTARSSVERTGSGMRGDGSPGREVGSPVGASLPPEALLARQYAEEALGEVAMDLEIDASALRQGARKLGLGSSASASAAAAAAVVARHGLDPAKERRRILDWALAGHRAIAPEGSGADVAAATLGGVVRFRRDAARDAEVIRWPEQLRVEVVWTGEPARTSDFLSKVRGLAEASPTAYREATAPLRDAAEALLAAVLDADAARAVRAAGAHGRAMQHLGERTGAGILTEPLARAAHLAEAHRGASKPSGAGGGDVALAFFADEEDAARFRRACASARLTLLPLALGDEGVRIEALPAKFGAMRTDGH